jgi:tetratricopeptide (TPR) repeat protein
MMWRFVSVLAFCALLFAQQPLDRAWQLAANGRQQEAIQVLNRFIKTNPESADARLLLGSLLMEAGQRTESIEQLTAGVRLRPSSAEADNALGEAYNKFGNVPAARAAFEKAVALKPDYGIAQSNLGQTLLASGEAAKAAGHLDRAIRLLGRTDDAADAHYLRAKVYSAQNEQKQAAAQLEQAVALRPRFAEAWSDLGQARRALLDDAGALAAFERAVAANPKGAIAQYRLGAEYLRQSKPHLAVEHLQKAYELNATDQSTLNSLQMALRQDGRPEEANTVKQQLAKLLRDKDKENQNHLNAVRLNNEGATAEKSGDLRAALAKYREAAQLYPEHAGIRVNYGVALLRLGQWTEGLDELHEALLRDPENKQIRAALKDALAQAPPNVTPKWKHDVQ